MRAFVDDTKRGFLLVNTFKLAKAFGLKGRMRLFASPAVLDRMRSR